jgi:hypothetical protein
VEIHFCVFSNSHTTSPHTGGALFVKSTASVINVYGTTFNGNTADSGKGADIYRTGAVITIHNTCPSPYSSNTPIQGKTRMRIV